MKIHTEHYLVNRDNIARSHSHNVDEISTHKNGIYAISHVKKRGLGA